MKIGVPREIYPGEKRVATTPDVAKELQKLGYAVAVESGAGETASYTDEAYRAAGCEVVSAREIWADSDIILKVRAPESGEAGGLRANQVLISFLWPAQNPALLARLTKTGATVMAMDSVPRISRAQKMDALSSMANIAGYRAVDRGRAALRPVLHRPDHRRGQGSAGQGAGDRRGRRGPRRDRRREEHWARSCARSTRGRKSRNRSRAWTPSS